MEFTEHDHIQYGGLNLCVDLQHQLGFAHEQIQVALKRDDIQQVRVAGALNDDVELRWAFCAVRFRCTGRNDEFCVIHDVEKLFRNLVDEFLSSAVEQQVLCEFHFRTIEQLEIVDDVEADTNSVAIDNQQAGGFGCVVDFCRADGCFGVAENQQLI